MLATSSIEGKPNANIVISLGFIDDKLLIADCHMSNTIRNIKENNDVCIIGGYFRIRGTAEVFGSGNYFDMCSKILSKQDSSLKMKNAIVVTVNESNGLDG